LRTPRKVAALYVDPVRGPYSARKGVDLWGVARDATKFAGFKPVVAHPPCGPWGRFYWRYKGGEGSAEAGLRAVEQVRNCGGVLEHPAQSNLWGKASKRRKSYSTRLQGVPDLPLPGEPPDKYGGYTIEVNQVDWGHAALKPTWLYIVGVPRAKLPRMPTPRAPTHVIVRKRSNPNELPELRKSLRHVTPPAFADWLLQVARASRKG